MRFTATFFRKFRVLSFLRRSYHLERWPHLDDFASIHEDHVVAGVPRKLYLMRHEYDGPSRMRKLAHYLEHFLDQFRIEH